MKKLLVIGFVWPEPKSSAAGKRMMQLLQFFQELEFEITFASTALNLEFSENLESLQIKTQQIVLNDNSFDTFCTELQPTIVLFDRFLTEEQFGWRVSQNSPNTIRILDTEDLHCLRHERQKAVKENRHFQLDSLLNSDLACREIASIFRCDLTLMVSKFEIELLQNHFSVPSALLFYIPILIDQIKTFNPYFNDRMDFAFIGNFLHEPNADAVEYLSRFVWPAINIKLPEAKMMVYGAYPTQKIMGLNNPKTNFFIKGRAENAKEIIKNARVVLAPIRFGAGIKGKLLEAMQMGTPSVTSTVGAEGIASDTNWNGFVTNNPETFANHAVALYTDSEIWAQSQQNGYKILEANFLKSPFETDFKNKIAQIQNDFIDKRNLNFIGKMLMHHSNQSTKYLSKWIEEKNRFKS